jgi:hypothetical protein
MKRTAQLTRKRPCGPLSIKSQEKPQPPRAERGESGKRLRKFVIARFHFTVRAMILSNRAWNSVLACSQAMF